MEGRSRRVGGRPPGRYLVWVGLGVCARGGGPVRGRVRGPRRPGIRCSVGGGEPDVQASSGGTNADVSG